MTRTPLRVAALLFFSGLCALIYQVTWLRELRLVFGASTPANAVVLAVFMGGLGYGSLLFGKRAERTPRPLALYSNLELGIGLSAAVTPLLLVVTRAAYVALGGTATLGSTLGTLVRLLLSALVLLPPTLLMGGTLPAAARAAIFDDDTGRRSTALLYGANALGAVVGAALTTFLLLEIFGTRLSLWLGCGINLLVAMMARELSRTLPELAPSSATAGQAERQADPARPPLSFVLVAAASTGFVFFLLELVWYRMLSPLLGGSTYTFGLILALALLGIGLGGVAYSLRGSDRSPTIHAFALSCTLEALFVAIPFALGDRIAVWTLMLRSFGVLGLSGQVVGWAAITSIVVVPAAIVSGYQFPLLIALLGKGRDAVGRQVGMAYAANTAGAIAGSLAGGFVLPLVTAPGAWKLGVWLLLVIGMLALGLGVRREGPRAWLGPRAIAPVITAAAAAGCLLAALGPTAVWRHSPIGAGRADSAVSSGRTRNELKRWMHNQRQAVSWEREGRESSVALSTLNDTAFLVNGKSDGAAVDDAPTQVMSGLLGALLHGHVKRALVIGLGTGSSAGWLAALPDIERVDVVEIEPAILDVARACSAVNHGVLDNPKVRIILADAREVLLTSHDHYDLIFSEPSNPYRAGIASLFTQEFYVAANDRLTDEGLFVQWVQAYEIDVPTFRTVYATLGSVFPVIETWRGDFNDLLLIGQRHDQPHDVAGLRARMTQDTYAQGLLASWRLNDLEGVFAHYVASPAFAKAIAEDAGEPAINTDDRNLLEFGIARSVGRHGGVSLSDVRRLAIRLGYSRPAIEGKVEWDHVDDALVELGMTDSAQPYPTRPPHGEARQHVRYDTFAAWVNNDMPRAQRAWESRGTEPRTPIELLVVADIYASLGNRQRAEPLLTRLANIYPTETLALDSRLLHAEDKSDEALKAALASLRAYQSDPWASNFIMQNLLAHTVQMVRGHPEQSEELYDLLGTSFAVEALHFQRETARIAVAMTLKDKSKCVTAFAAFEHAPIWEEKSLRDRLDCYQHASSPLQTQAREDLLSYLEAEGPTISEDLLPNSGAPADDEESEERE